MPSQSDKYLAKTPLPWVRTPLIKSAILSKLAGCDIYLKLENIQPSGSFKSRGIGNLVLKHALSFPDKPHHFYISSGGNAGLACTTAASTLGYTSTIVLPTSIKPFMIQKLRALGAEIVQIGATWLDADTYLRETLLAKDPAGVYVPPFDHPDVWEGAATMIPEVVEDLGSLPDGIVCSVGGGGLMSGICQGIDDETNQGKKATVIAVETAGAESLYEAVKAGKLVTIPGITSIATSLGATRVAPKTLEYGLQSHVNSQVVSDKEATEACLRFLDDERILVEPACGATLAMVYSGKLNEMKEQLGFTEDSKVVLVVCGGSNISLEMLLGYKEMLGL